MNKELEEAIEILNKKRKELGLYADGEKVKLGFSIETVLQALENSISKKEIKKILDKYAKEPIDCGVYFYKEIKDLLGGKNE